jgi:TetR/AcrR family transcriptional regulator
MARRPSETKRNEIVAVATQLFAERGFDALSMGDLAEAVGLRKASLFHYFASKDQLYARVLGDLVEKVGATVLGAVAADGAFEDRLDALSDGITDVLGEYPHAARLLVREALKGRPIVNDAVDAKIDVVLEAARELVKQGQADRIVDAELDPTNVIVTLVGLHFLPFALGDALSKFTGGGPSIPDVLAARKKAVRVQVRRLMLVAPQRKD